MNVTVVITIQNWMTMITNTYLNEYFEECNIMHNWISFKIQIYNQPLAKHIDYSTTFTTQSSKQWVHPSQLSLQLFNVR